MDDTPIIEFKDVSFSYDTNTVLENVSFSVPSGDYVGVLGPNGSGKTTMMKIILGLLKPAQGTVRIFGKDATRLTAKDRSLIGFVPQRISEGRMEFPATVEEIVQSGRSAVVGIGRGFKPHDYQKSDEAMHVAGVTELRKRLITQLSGGQVQRVLIARALAAEPQVLVLDEPTVGVDIASQEQFYSFIKDLNEQKGLTIIFVSHDIDVITHESKTVLCLNRTLVCHGPSREVMSGDALEKLYGKKLRFILHGH